MQYQKRNKKIFRYSCSKIYEDKFQGSKWFVRASCTQTKCDITDISDNSSEQERVEGWDKYLVNPRCGEGENPATRSQGKAMAEREILLGILFSMGIQILVL